MVKKKMKKMLYVNIHFGPLQGEILYPFKWSVTNGTPCYGIGLGECTQKPMEAHRVRCIINKADVTMR